MSEITLIQGGVTATLSELAYYSPQGIQEQGAWYATEECIAADSDTQLQSGPATLIHSGKEYLVKVNVMEFGEASGEEDDPEEDKPAYMIEMEYAHGLPKLAYILGLLDAYNKKQLAAVGIVV